MTGYSSHKIGKYTFGVNGSITRIGKGKEPIVIPLLIEDPEELAKVQIPVRDSDGRYVDLRKQSDCFAHLHSLDDVSVSEDYIALAHATINDSLNPDDN